MRSFSLLPIPKIKCFPDSALNPRSVELPVLKSDAALPIYEKVVPLVWIEIWGPSECVELRYKRSFEAEVTVSFAPSKVKFASAFKEVPLPVAVTSLLSA